MGLADILFPIKKSFDDINQPDDLEKIQQNNLDLAQRLTEQERLKSQYPMKRYHIEVVSGGVILPYTIEARGFEYSECGTYYFYDYKFLNDGRRDREILSHFPIDKTIIKKIEKL
jgi:hypothetical protein